MRILKFTFKKKKKKPITTVFGNEVHVLKNGRWINLHRESNRYLNMDFAK